MSSTVQLGILLREDTSRGFFRCNHVLLGLQTRGGLQRTQRGYIITLTIYHWSRMQGASTSNQSLRTTLTPQLLLYSSWIKNKSLERVVNLMNNINTLLTWIRSWLREKSQKQAQVELGSTMVQAVKRAPIGWHFLQTLPSLSISLFLFTKARS